MCGNIRAICDVLQRLRRVSHLRAQAQEEPVQTLQRRQLPYLSTDRPGEAAP